LSVYSLMDISLDPFPYAGTTTTMESLFMGVPVITLAGNCHAHNVSCSLLSAVGLAEQWVAQDAEQYVALAVQHAADVAALQQLRQGLRQQMLSARMCDWQPFVAGLEDTYDAMWQRWVQQGGRQLPVAAASKQQQQQQHDVAAAQQQQQQCVHLVEDCTASASAAAAPAGLTVTIAAGLADSDAKTAAAVANNSRQGMAAAAAAAGTQQLPECSMADDGNCKGGRADQNCGSKKVSSRGLHGALTTELCAAVAPAAADAAVAQAVQAAAVGEGSILGSSGAHKGRKISSSCDAAATMHAGSAGDSRDS
jgi:hypothetical protein